MSYDLNDVPDDLIVEDSDGSSTPSEYIADDEDDTSGQYSDDVQSTSAGNTNDDHESPSNMSNNAEYSDSRFKPGSVFRTFLELHAAYKEHARLKGFGVAKRNKDHRYARITCAKGGSRVGGKSSIKTDCKAVLNAKKLDDGSWCINSIVHEHSHELDPGCSIFIPCHRRISGRMKRQLESNDVAGIRPCQNVRICEVQSGGPLNLGCIPNDCRNFIAKRRRLRLADGDAEAIRNMLTRIQLQEPNFFHLMDIDPRGRLRNVLWIHPRCRAAYQEFHDVVSFDTTYRVNRYNMPFASFVGVNHHGHSILLGCALVTHEDADSFRWLFRNWLEAMNGVQPTAIITDQCESIRKAIGELMPATVHRLCIWHILSKLPKKLKGVSNYNDCTTELTALIYDSLDTRTFESKWAEFLEKYGLANNAWLAELYRERQRWVPVYLNHIFWGGMLSTQRSEGMHAYFDEFLHSRNNLKRFMEQYDMAIAKKIQKEFHADFQSKNKELRCITAFPWEKQFQKAYTNSIFSLLQNEVNRMIYCHVREGESSNNVGGIKKFNVLERCIINNFYHKEYNFSVEWRPNGSYVNCNCKKFEFKGIMCCHSLKVLTEENVQTVHPRYLLDRWKKTLHRPHSRIFVGGGYPTMTEEYKKYLEVDKYFQECIDVAMGSADKMAYVKAKCRELKDSLLVWGEGSGVSDTRAPPNDLDADVGPPRPLLDPPVIIPRGRPRGEGRLLSAAEASIRGRGGRGRGRGATLRGRRGSRGRVASNSRTSTSRGISGTQEMTQESAYQIDLNEEFDPSNGSVFF